MLYVSMLRLTELIVFLDLVLATYSYIVKKKNLIIVS